MEASVGILGDSSIIFSAKSFTESTNASNSSSDSIGLTSFNSEIFPL